MLRTAYCLHCAQDNYKIHNTACRLSTVLCLPTLARRVCPTGTVLGYTFAGDQGWCTQSLRRNVSGITNSGACWVRDALQSASLCVACLGKCRLLWQLELSSWSEDILEYETERTRQNTRVMRSLASSPWKTSFNLFLLVPGLLRFDSFSFLLLGEPKIETIEKTAWREGGWVSAVVGPAATSTRIESLVERKKKKKSARLGSGRLSTGNVAISEGDITDLIVLSRPSEPQRTGCRPDRNK